MSTFNFNELTKLSRKITRSGGSAELSRTTDKEGKTTFRLSQEMFDRLGLAMNSLSTMSHPKDKTQVFIVTNPANTGDILKAREGKKAKGLSFLHNELSKALDEAGFSGLKEFALASVGVNEGKEYFQVSRLPMLAVGEKQEKPALKSKEKAQA